MEDNIEPTNIEEQRTWAEVGGLEADYFDGDYPETSNHRSLTAGLLPEQAAPVFDASSPQEMRALWVTRWDYHSADDIRIIADRAADANFNTLYFQVRGNADALYRSQIEPWSALLTGTLGQDPGWDPLATAVHEAHTRGLEVHAWVNVYPAWLGETPPPSTTPEQMYNSFNQLYEQEWVMWNRHQEPMSLNKEYLWSNPGHFAVLEHIVAVGHDIVQRYYVDGLHLDNVRYASWEYSRDPLTLAEVEEAQSVDPTVDRKVWQRWQVNTLVSRLREAIDSTKPGLLLSAAVWPVYQDTWEWWSAGDGYEGFCQDSVGWIGQQTADLISPMLYLSSITTDDDQFAALVNDFVARAGGDHVAAGITATYDTFDPIARRIDITRQAGCSGQAIFAYGHVNQKRFWEEFRRGPYATPAAVLIPESSRERTSAMLRAA